jgi:segregation and condensation protein A
VRLDQPQLDFQAAEQAAEQGEALIVDLDGYEGPLHVLLALARSQKVDLLSLSVADLADQYLAFIHEARRRRFGLAADYLVMAAWLAYLKSRLLLPRPEKKDDEPPAEELAATLAFRLQKLQAMRTAVEDLQSRPRLGVAVFTRGDPEARTVTPSLQLRSSLHELLGAYVGQRRRDAGRRYRPTAPVVYPLDDARDRLRRLLPEMKAWTPLQSVAPPAREAEPGEAPTRASCLASTLSAGLELVKEGRLEARQLAAFEDVYLRRRESAA